MATTTSRTDTTTGDGPAAIEVRCPADDRVVGSVPDEGRAGVERAASELRAAQPAWEALGFAGRARWLGRLRDWLLDNEQRLLRLSQQESGKSWGDTNMGEVAVAVQVLNYAIENAENFLAPRRPRPHTVAMATKRLEVTYRPYRLVGAVTPWNAPIANPMLDVPFALMAGCAVLTKPSEVTPLAWTEVVRGWREDLGAPAVLAAVNGRGETGAAVVDVVDMVQFTGSTRTGRAIAERAAARLIPASLELGGKDAMIVCADADLDRAAGAAVWGGFYNSGQICVSVERVYVDESVYDAFLERVVAKTRALRTGMDEPGSFATDIGSLANAAQFEIVERHVTDAVERGARSLTGGRRSGTAGSFYEPTVLVDVDHSMACMREETFGPTLPVMRVSGTDEAVRLANDTAYGLSASVWTSDDALARDIAGRLEVGTVNVNNAMTNVFQFPVPMGGWGDSGLGARFGGPDGIRKYCRPKTLVAERVAPKSEVFWYPNTKRRSGMMARATRFLGGRDVRRRLGLRAKG